jgi:SM-20-related protein
LRIYHGSHEDEVGRDLLPDAGRLVCFLSDRFPHQVLPARRERFSLTGWFKVREQLPF